MSKYRIKKVTDNQGITLYYPQKKVLWWWEDVFGFGRYNYGGCFSTLEEAQEKLRGYFKYPVVEYIEFDPKRD